MHPEAGNYAFDLDKALDAIVTVRALVPPDALTAEVLGTERVGHGALVEGGLILTIGYLVTEAQTIWITFNDGTVLGGHVLGYDQTTGFGLIQPLGRVQHAPLTFGNSSAVSVGDAVIVAGAGGEKAALAARVVAKQEFAGYWEYVLDEAIFTMPAHPNWGGTGVLDGSGRLVGIGSLQIQDAEVDGQKASLNMIVPIDLLKPILSDLASIGHPDRTPRPWLGLYATEVDGQVVVIGTAEGGPAQESGLASGDFILSVGDQDVTGLAEFFRMVWAAGPAGARIDLTVVRDGEPFEVAVDSVDRRALLKGPVVH